MNPRTTSPWASGPAEILLHGMELLRDQDSDRNRRLAIISIDNSVELMTKVFLGLPKRANGLTITRKELAEAESGFPKLMDAIEAFASDRLEGIDLAEIEWYHRLRNELYHQGNGLTVEREKVEIYAELAKLLFKNLFGDELLLPERDSAPSDLGSFMEQWVALERKLHSLVVEEGKRPYPRALMDGMRFLTESGHLSPKDAETFDRLRALRNQLVHGELDHREVLTSEVLSDLEALIERIPSPNSG